MFCRYCTLSYWSAMPHLALVVTFWHIAGAAGSSSNVSIKLCWQSPGFACRTSSLPCPLTRLVAVAVFLCGTWLQAACQGMALPPMSSWATARATSASQGSTHPVAACCPAAAVQQTSPALGGPPQFASVCVRKVRVQGGGWLSQAWLQHLSTAFPWIFPCHTQK